MAPPLSIDTGFVLGDWEVRPRHGHLTSRVAPGAEPLTLEPRVMAVLVFLAHHAGEVVTRDEFIADVWGGRVVSDEALSRCISLLRQALGEDSHEPRYIRTVARVGYTLLEAPCPLPAAGSAAESPLPAPPASLDRPHRPAAWQRRALVLGGGLLLALAAALALRYGWQARQAPVEAPAAPVSRLLVLPFDTTGATDFGRDVGSELADEIADALARVDRLRIIGRTSALAVAASRSGAVDAGRRLGVDAVLDGAVAESAAGLRVTVRLTATRDAHLIWSKVYERKPSEIYAVESSIASTVVRELTGLLGREGVAGVSSVEPETRDLEAYRLYLRGAHQVRLRGEDSLRRAIDLFAAAVRRDPTYARAHAGLANAYALLPCYTFEDPAEMYALAEKSLATAESVAHSKTVGAGTRAYLGFMRWQWIEAETAFRTAIAAEPNNPDVRQLYSQLLGAVGRLDAALRQARLAQELDPLAPVVADRISILDLWLGQDAESAKSDALARELGLEEQAYPETKVLLKLHEHADAAAADALRDLQHAVNRSDAWIGPTLRAYRNPGERHAALDLLDREQRLGTLSPRIYFGATVLLEAPARALHGFEALIDRDPNDLEFLFSTDAAAIRRDPAFGAFVDKMGLAAYWDRFGWPRACRREGVGIACH